ncbi:MAG: T9SS type A sorting domain-containing protein, partial [Salibacteraceae bacterium]
NSSQANGFSWNIPGAIYTNGTSPSSAEPEVFWNSGGFNSNVVLTATGVNGSDHATGSVAVPVPNVNPSFGFCPANPVTGQVVTLNNTTTGDGNPAQYNYNWTISGGPTFVNGTTPFSASPQILWNSTGLNSISLQACYQPGNYCASSGSQNVQVYTPVVADFTVNTNEQSSNSACTGFGVTTNNLSTGATNYTWSYSDGFSPNLATDFETAILFFNPGWQTITLTATNGPITDQHSVQVFVYDPYTITETYTPATNSTCSNGGLDVNITYNDPNLNPTSFSWWDVLTLTEIPGLNTNHLVANGTIPAGTYPVAYFDNIGCGKLVNIVIPCNNGSQPRLSTEPNEAMLDALGELGSGTIAEPLTELELYPNPTSNVATLSYQLKKEAEVQVSVFNSLGQEVTVLAQGSQAQGAHQLEVSRSELGLDAGIYFVRITASDQLTTQKLVLAD